VRKSFVAHHETNACNRWLFPFIVSRSSKKGCDQMVA
jgi:hypothetical protein